MRDLLGDPLRGLGLPPRERSRFLYELADRAPAGSAERLSLYRVAAAAQVLADWRDAEAALRQRRRDRQARPVSERMTK